jgi:hypothetical protein
MILEITVHSVYYSLRVLCVILPLWAQCETFILISLRPPKNILFAVKN